MDSRTPASFSIHIRDLGYGRYFRQHGRKLGKACARVIGLPGDGEAIFLVTVDDDAEHIQDGIPVPIECAASVKHSERGIMDKKIQGPYVFVHMESIDEASFYILSKSEFIDIVNTTDDAYFFKPRTKPIKQIPVLEF